MNKLRALPIRLATEMVGFDEDMRVVAEVPCRRAGSTIGAASSYPSQI